MQAGGGVDDFVDFELSEQIAVYQAAVSLGEDSEIGAPIIAYLDDQVRKWGQSVLSNYEDRGIPSPPHRSVDEDEWAESVRSEALEMLARDRWASIRGDA